jgi:dihydrodipicolinate synthase/N-acetylneuraminate lyase
MAGTMFGVLNEGDVGTFFHASLVGRLVVLLGDAPSVIAVCGCGDGVLSVVSNLAPEATASLVPLSRSVVRDGDAVGSEQKC